MILLPIWWILSISFNRYIPWSTKAAYPVPGAETLERALWMAACRFGRGPGISQQRGGLWKLQAYFHRGPVNFSFGQLGSVTQAICICNDKLNRGSYK